MSTTFRIFRFIDYFVFIASMIFLAILVISSGMANIQTDSIDYYAIVQRLTQRDSNPIVRNLHFVEQRSPGYPILSLIPYSVIASVVNPFVQTEKIVLPVNPPESVAQVPTERMLLPAIPVRFRDIFFRNYYIETQDSWFEWKIIASMLITSYAFLFSGLICIAKSPLLKHRFRLGTSLAPLMVITSPVFMHNIVNTPGYATLTAFGVSCLFATFFEKGLTVKKRAPQLLSGLFVGILVLTRLETIVIAAVVLIALVVIREFGYMRNYVLGALAPALILLFYNFNQFGNPFYLKILAGDINQISLNWEYIYNNLFYPQSGIFFWSTLTCLGIIGLFLDDQRYSKILGICSSVLIFLFLVRVPVMYTCMGEGAMLIGGLSVACPESTEDKLMLIRFDANRYIVVLIPFAITGLRNLFASIPTLFSRIRQTFHKKLATS